MLEDKNNWKAWLYLLPGLILLGLFSFYPLIKSFIIAFIRDYYPVREIFKENIAAYKASGATFWDRTFFTFKNFKSVMFVTGADGKITGINALFKYAVVNTLLIAVVSVPISVIISLVISVLLISITKARGFFQTLFFLPYVTSAMAVAMAFTVLFANTGTTISGVSNGPINSALEATGLKTVITAQLDTIEWNMNGKENWYAYICVTKDGKATDEEKLASKYKIYVNKCNLTGDEIEYTTKEEYQEKFLKADTATYNNYRHHFKTAGYIDWVGGNSTWGSAIVVVLMYSIWAGLAFKVLVFTGGLTSIDKQYYDAAKIDGTSKWRTFWRITVPMMSPLIVYILITSLIGSFKTYTSIVGLFGADMGKDHMMMTFVGLVYRFMNQGNDQIHIGAAAAVILFIIILLMTLLTNGLTKKRVHY